MGQQILKTIKQQGYCVVKNIIDPLAIAHLNFFQNKLEPQRGHDFTAKYFPKKDLTGLEELAIWWSQQVVDWPCVHRINQQLLYITQSWFDNNCVYVSDVITNEPGNQFVKPHIDSPYRFDEWHEEVDLLGVQCIVPLCEFNKDNGGTGLYPGSHLKNWIVKDSYKGVYTEEFLANVIQPKMNIGDVLIYNPRVLHSTMPNNTTLKRRALLTHITTKEMVKKLKLVDNIWLEQST
jgi:ectoine hydroxylase-related dioxygenase (phytanoyl-CoA dioxygenase family)